MEKDISGRFARTELHKILQIRELTESTFVLRMERGEIQFKPGQQLQVNGPFGSFGPEKYDLFSRKLVFVASETGISPFHSFVRSYPGIDYFLFHGVRFSGEAYEREDYDPARYILCTSQESTGGNTGRVTGVLQDYPLSGDMLFYLCGNNNMIYFSWDT